MNLFTRTSPYYHLLKYFLFLLKHPLYIIHTLRVLCQFQFRETGMDYYPVHYAAALGRCESVVVFEIPVFSKLRLNSN